MLGWINSKVPPIGDIFRFLLSSFLIEDIVPQRQQAPCTCLNTITRLLFSLPSPRLDVPLSSFIFDFHIQYFSFFQWHLSGSTGKGKWSQSWQCDQHGVNRPGREPDNICKEMAELASKNSGRMEKPLKCELSDFFSHFNIPFYHYLPFFPIHLSLGSKM